MIAAAVTRQGAGAALVACGQLGLPAAIATLGIQTGRLSPGVGGTILVAGLISVPIATVGVRMLARGAGPTADTARHGSDVAR